MKKDEVSIPMIDLDNNCLDYKPVHIYIVTQREP